MPPVPSCEDSRRAELALSRSQTSSSSQVLPLHHRRRPFGSGHQHCELRVQSPSLTTLRTRKSKMTIFAVARRSTASSPSLSSGPCPSSSTLESTDRFTFVSLSTFGVASSLVSLFPVFRAAVETLASRLRAYSRESWEVSDLEGADKKLREVAGLKIRAKDVSSPSERELS